MSAVSDQREMGGALRLFALNFTKLTKLRILPKCWTKSEIILVAVRAKQSVTRASKEAVAKPRATPVVTLKRLAANLSESHEMSKKQTEAVLGDLVGLVTKHLKRGDRIRLGGLGILQVRKRAARMGRNPATAERIQLLGPAVIRERPQQKKYRVCLLNNLLRARMSRLPALWRYCVVKRSARVT